MTFEHSRKQWRTGWSPDHWHRSRDLFGLGGFPGGLEQAKVSSQALIYPVWKEAVEVGYLFTLFSLDLSVLPQEKEQIRSAPRTWISFYLRWWLIDRAGMVADSPGM